MGLALTKLPYGGVPGPWHLIMNEEFRESSLSSLWAPYYFSDGTAVNNVNCYAANVSVVPSKGLVLNLAGSNSGALVMSNKNVASPGFEFSYGYVEAQVTFPANNDWSAFWLLGDPYPSGEFDVAETNVATKIAVGNYHYGSGDSTGISDPSPVSGATGQPHIFGLNWQPGLAQFYLDGVMRPVSIPSVDVVTGPQYIIFNHGIQAGDYSGVGSDVVVRYVRVWQH